ncbi:GNAT family N-acetyltransferase [Terrilactibacillus sp. BCM23-1]|uniref:GNAT family N-acetyltransferase n=2 Tax=Terrilactibacillus tamarindi TaxID=2599694 RepID=A0A6N8CLN6_9BACI|nr:GNAT family N-acetyltransferase [Terrilactibacillus tamarindi]MTT30458.1 GNAT family N-acetyltransferase [Terrilactibacillus tamarindi]
MQKKLHDFFTDHWGSPEMVLSTGTYTVTDLDGFVCIDSDKRMIGLITYTLHQKSLEIISLDSLKENRGYGTHLLKKVEEVAIQKGLHQIQVITTNDNLHALRFYQKRDYYISQVFPGAVIKAREKKPDIPLVGYADIPIRDEILLIKQL